MINHVKILSLIAQIFEFDTENNIASENGLSQQMDIEHNISQKFKVKLQSIIHFIILEHAFAKSEYSVI